MSEVTLNTILEELIFNVTVQDTHYPKMKSGFPEIAFLIAS